MIIKQSTTARSRGFGLPRKAWRTAVNIGVGLFIRGTQIDRFQKPTPNFPRFVLEFSNNCTPERQSLSGSHGHRPWVSLALN
jgi:hypothetical protein